jgi:hypothetical protein
MALTLADGRTRLVILTTAPADPNAITTAEFAAGIEAADFINKPDFKMSPTNPDTVPDQPISQKGNATTWGNSNFEAAMTVLRDLNPTTGLPEAAGDEVWEAVETAGTTIWPVKRTGPLEEVPWTAGQPYLWAKVVTGEPQDPQDMAGYVKNPIPLGPQEWGRGEVDGGS